LIVESRTSGVRAFRCQQPDAPVPAEPESVEPGLYVVVPEPLVLGASPGFVELGGFIELDVEPEPYVVMPEPLVLGVVVWLVPALGLFADSDELVLPLAVVPPDPHGKPLAPRRPELDGLVAGGLLCVVPPVLGLADGLLNIPAEPPVAAPDPLPPAAPPLPPPEPPDCANTVPAPPSATAATNVTSERRFMLLAPVVVAPDRQREPARRVPGERQQKPLMFAYRHRNAAGTLRCMAQ
jgi:hypothetical protein